VWSCLGGDDASIGCVGEPVQRVDVLRPSPAQSGFPAPARAALLDAFDRLTLPAAPGELCTRRMTLDVPTGRTRLALRVAALGASGLVDRDTLKLSCAPATP
jgi:hypothetical protein